MAVPSERLEGVAFPRPLPRPVFFIWATWIGACAFAYWTYLEAPGAEPSVLLSIVFWVFAVVVIPRIAHRSRERMAGLVTAMLALLIYTLLMQDALR